MFKKSPTLRHFKPDRDEIWQDCSSTKFTSTDGGFLIWRHSFKMAAMTLTLRSLLHMQQVRRLSASPPSAFDVTGSLYALQFLIHSTFVLVRLSWSHSPPAAIC